MERQKIEISVGAVNGNGLHECELRCGEKSFSGTVNAASPFLRESFLKSALQALHLPTKDVGSLGENLYRLSRDKTAEKGRLPPIQDAAVLCAKDLPTPPELVQGLLHRSSKLQLGGASKSFTTWTLGALALTVAYGLPWLGFCTCPAKVLLVDLELSTPFCRKRLLTLQESLGIQQKTGNLSIWNLRGFSTCHREIFPKIIRRTVGEGYGLIVLDPLYKLYGMGTDENSARDVGDLLNSVELLTVETGAAIAYRSHYSKGNQAAKIAIDRVSGSGVFARDPDSLLNFTAHDEGEGYYTVDATLRNFPPMESFVVHWSFPLFERRNDLNPAALKGPAGRPAKYTAEQVLGALQDGMSGTDWQEASGIPRTTFFRLRRELEEAGKVEKREELWYQSHNPKTPF
jgi:hypothetical protein